MQGKGGYRIFFIAGHENDVQVRLQVLELLGQRQPAHIAHLNIQKSGVDRMGLGIRQRLCRGRKAGAAAVGGGFRQSETEVVQTQGFVVDR